MPSELSSGLFSRNLVRYGAPNSNYKKDQGSKLKEKSDLLITMANRFLVKNIIAYLSKIGDNTTTKRVIESGNLKDDFLEKLIKITSEAKKIEKQLQFARQSNKGFE